MKKSKPVVSETVSAKPAETVASTPLIPAPTLTVTLRLYLLVVLGTLAITFGLSTAVPDIAFLRLVTAVFVVGGLLILTVLLTGNQPRTVFGFSPRLMFLVTGFLAGIALYLPATWLLLLSGQLLGGIFGNLPQLTGARPFTSFGGQFAIYGVLIPFCQGMLFFGFLQNAARALGAWRGAFLTALLYGLYTYFGAAFQLGNGLAALPNGLLIGTVAALLTARSGSPLVGALVLSGSNLGGAIYPASFVQSLVATGDILSLQWLASVLVTGFITLLLVQFSSIFGRPHERFARQPPPSFWWSPLVVIAVLVVLLVYGEIGTRRLNPARGVAPPPNSGSTIAPGTVPSQTPQTAN